MATTPTITRMGTTAPTDLQVCNERSRALLHRGFALAAQVLARTQKQRAKKRAARKSASFTIWEDPAEPAAVSPNLAPFAPPPYMLAPWYASDEDDNDDTADPPDADADANAGFAEGGDTWCRLGSDPAYLHNDAGVCLFLTTLRMLDSRYRLTVDGHIVVLDTERQSGGGGAATVRREDVVQLRDALEHGPYRDLFNNPIWQAWRTAPGDDADVDPDMDRVLAALQRQRRRFLQLRIALLAYSRSFTRSLREMQHVHTHGTLLALHMEGLLATERSPTGKAKENARKTDSLRNWDTTWTRSMR